MLQTNAAGVLGLGVFKSNLISLGHISEWAAVRVEPDGMRLMRTNVLDDTIQLSEWEAPPKEEAHPALSDEELREKVLHVLQQHQKPNGTLLGATAVWGRINPLALPGCTKVRVLDAHKALANDGFITVNGNTVRWAEDTVPRSATAA